MAVLIALFSGLPADAGKKKEKAQQPTVIKASETKFGGVKRFQSGETKKKPWFRFGKKGKKKSVAVKKVEVTRPEVARPEDANPPQPKVRTPASEAEEDKPVRQPASQSIATPDPLPKQAESPEGK